MSKGRSACAIAIASSTLHGQLVSTIKGTPGPTASRAAFTASTVISCSLISR